MLRFLFSLLLLAGATTSAQTVNGPPLYQTQSGPPFAQVQTGPPVQSDPGLCEAPAEPGGESLCDASAYTPERELECLRRWAHRAVKIAGRFCDLQASSALASDPFAWQTEIVALWAERNEADRENDAMFQRCLCSKWWTLGIPNAPSPLKPGPVIVVHGTPPPNPDRLGAPDLALLEHLVGQGWDVRFTMAALGLEPLDLAPLEVSR